MEVIKEGEIDQLAIPRASSRASWLMRNVLAKTGQLALDDVASKPVSPASLSEVVKTYDKCRVPPFSHKVVHGKIGLYLHDCRMNVMTHGLEKRSPLLPLGLDVQSAYAMLAPGSKRVAVILRNNTQDWLEIKKRNTGSENSNGQPDTACHRHGIHQRFGTAHYSQGGGTSSFVDGKAGPDCLGHLACPAGRGR